MSGRSYRDRPPAGWPGPLTGELSPRAKAVLLAALVALAVLLCLIPPPA